MHNFCIFSVFVVLHCIMCPLQYLTLICFEITTYTYRPLSLKINIQLFYSPNQSLAQFSPLTSMISCQQALLDARAENPNTRRVRRHNQRRKHKIFLPNTDVHCSQHSLHRAETIAYVAGYKRVGDYSQ